MFENLSRKFRLLPSLVGMAALAGLLLPAPLSASSLDVEAAAARPGSGTGCGGSGCGARLQLSGCATTHDLVIPDQQVSSSQTFEGCSSVTASNVDVADGANVTFRAGQTIRLGDGFSVASGASFTAAIDANLQGDAALEDRSPVGETRYVARFYVNLDAMSLPGSEQFEQFVGYDGGGQAQFRVVFKHDDGLNENRLFVEVRNDAGGFVSTEGGSELAIPSGWHAIEVDWRAANSSAVNDGQIVVCLDDDGSRLSCEQLSAVDNDQGRIDFVQWGALGVDPNTTGSFDMDDFDSRRAGPIGL